MFYLQDCLENIENLPREVKNNLAQIRELDIEVQSTKANIAENLEVLFSNAEHIDEIEFKASFNAIMEVGSKSLIESDKKIKLAGDTKKKMDSYLIRVDAELHKFKMEMEADNCGITEIIEKRSLDLELKENQNRLNRYNAGSSNQISNSTASTSTSSGGVASSSRRDRSPVHFKLGPAYSLAYNLSTTRAGNSAIEAAASEAIVATQQLSQGRRTASLKASLEAISSGIPLTGEMSSASDILSSELPIGKELAGIANEVKSNMDTTKKRGRQCKTKTSLTSSEEDDEEPVDPNEPRYCKCNRIAYGTMVACDSKRCPYEWYHLDCVGISVPPKGKWYCPQCRKTNKSRRSRKPHK